MTTITTQPVKRSLQFNNFNDILAEARRIASPGATAIGNWTAAQNIAHVGIAIRYSVKGFPDFKPPLFFKLMGPLIGPRMIKKGLPSGIKIAPELARHAIPPADITPEQALEQLAAAIELTRPNGMPQKHPGFGKLNNAQWEAFHCRHAELHFGNIIPA